VAAALNYEEPEVFAKRMRKKVDLRIAETLKQTCK